MSWLCRCCPFSSSRATLPDTAGRPARSRRLPRSRRPTAPAPPSSPTSSRDPTRHSPRPSPRRTPTLLASRRPTGLRHDRNGARSLEQERLIESPLTTLEMVSDRGAAHRRARVPFPGGPDPHFGHRGPVLLARDPGRGLLADQFGLRIPADLEPLMVALARGDHRLHGVHALGDAHAVASRGQPATRRPSGVRDVPADPCHSRRDHLRGRLDAARGAVAGDPRPRPGDGADRSRSAGRGRHRRDPRGRTLVAPNRAPIRAARPCRVPVATSRLPVWDRPCVVARGGAGATARRDGTPSAA